jgi:hypothetical protein
MTLYSPKRAAMRVLMKMGGSRDPSLRRDDKKFDESRWNGGSYEDGGQQGSLLASG